MRTEKALVCQLTLKMPRRKNVKGLKQYSNDNNLQGVTSFQKAYQRGDKRSVNQDCCPAASATTTPNDVMITASEHQQRNSIEFVLLPSNGNMSNANVWLIMFNQDLFNIQNNIG